MSNLASQSGISARTIYCYFITQLTVWDEEAMLSFKSNCQHVFYGVCSFVGCFVLNFLREHYFQLVSFFTAL